ncbi:MAG: ABC transporter permease [Acidobacteriota bacterium]
MNGLLSDLRVGARGLLRRPGFTLTIVIALGLGIGASTAIFSVLNAVVLRPLPWSTPDRIVSFSEVREDLPGEAGATGAFMLSNVREWRERSETFEAIAAYWNDAFTLTGVEEPRNLNGLKVTPDLFRVLGVGAERGRVFEQAEVEAGEEKLAVFSHAAWQRYFGGDDDLLGRAVTLDDEVYTAVGVMPADFEFPDPDIEVWVPLLWKAPEDPNRVQEIMLPVIGRLNDGFTLAQAEAEGNNLLSRLREERGLARRQAVESGEAQAEGERRVVRRRSGEEGEGAAAAPPAGPPEIPEEPQSTLVLQTILDQQVAPVRPALRVLTGAVALMLLIACANVANLLLSRGLQRRRELATRAALGAGRSGLARILFAESLSLCLAGGLLGLVLAAGGLQLLRRLDPGDIPRLAEVGVDPTVAGFALLLSLACAALFGLAPALQMRMDRLLGSLGREGGPVVRGRSLATWFSSGLVVVELALALVLLVGAGLLANSFLRLVSIDPGFRSEGVTVAQVAAPFHRYPTGEARQAFFEGVLERLRSRPEVEHAGFVNFLPPVRGRIQMSMQIEGQPPPEGPMEDRIAEMRLITPGYLEAMGIELVGGRFLEDRDRDSGSPVMVVNEQFVKRFFPEEGGAVGERAAMFGEIVGVVGDVRAQGLDSDPEPTFYIPLRQAPAMLLQHFDRMALVAKSDRDTDLAAALREAVLAVDPTLAVADVETLSQRMSESVGLPRFYASVLGLFALLALALSVLGVYGLLSYLVSQQKRETGIRMAIGARRDQVLRGTVIRGVKLSAAGLGLGLLGAWALRSLLASMLFGIEAGDPMTFVGVAAVLFLTSTAACYFPGRRAASTDPVTALREE